VEFNSNAILLFRCYQFLLHPFTDNKTAFIGLPNYRPIPHHQRSPIAKWPVITPVLYILSRRSIAAATCSWFAAARARAADVDAALSCGQRRPQCCVSRGRRMDTDLFIIIIIIIIIIFVYQYQVDMRSLIYI